MIQRNSFSIFDPYFDPYMCSQFIRTCICIRSREPRERNYFRWQTSRDLNTDHIATAEMAHLICMKWEDVVEREDAPTSSVWLGPMIAPSLIVLVHVLFIVIHCRKRDLYWMVVDLTQMRARVRMRIFVRGLPSERTRIETRIGSRSTPEGREYCVEAQPIRQTPDHHSRLQ